MKHDYSILLAPLLLLGTACSVEVSDGGDATEAVDTTTQAVGGTFTKDGFTVKWTKVTNSTWLTDIAGCSAPYGGFGVWALEEGWGGEIYKLTSNGTNWDLTFITSFPWDPNHPTPILRELACSNGGTLYYLDTDHRMFRSTNGTSWTHVNTPGDAEHLSSGGDRIYALNYNKALYDGTSNSDGTWGGWTYRNTPGGADWVTGGNAEFAPTKHRAFALNTDNSTWYNDKIRTSTSNANWKTFPNGGLALVEITAARSNVLLGLTDTTNEIWRADFEEADCFDNVDNDADGLLDAREAVCRDDWADYVCDHSGNGKYCFSRWASENTIDLAVCSGGNLVRIESGDACVKVGSGGSDYTYIVK